ncbi:MAG TPA: HAMP domain-containing protein, partial [Nitrospinaceae bacterium]|nr:HAMP domain-containing protein [Nitrospinaceae bacterium]
MQIRHKIFGVALLVFTLMGLSILFSTQKLYQVNRGVTALAEVFIPLSKEIAEIDLQIAQQKLHVERLEKYLTVTKLNDEELHKLAGEIPPEHLQTGPESLAEKQTRLEAENIELKRLIVREEEDFGVRELNVDAAIKNAENIVEKAVDRTVTIEKVKALLKLLVHLQSINQQHSSLHAQKTLLIRALKQQSPTLFELKKLIEEEEDKLAESMAVAWEEISYFTEIAAKKAAEHERQALTVNIVLAAVSGVLALLLSSLVIQRILQPLRLLMDCTRKIESGDLSGEIEIKTRDEISDLSHSFNNMVYELRKTEEIKGKFGQYVDPRVVSRLISDPDLNLADGEKKVVSVFFADFANFTGISERFTPSGLVKLINRYFSLMSRPVTEHQGLID